MLNEFKATIIIYLVLGIALVGSGYVLWRDFQLKTKLTYLTAGQVKQPALEYEVYPWAVRSVDTQTISKHWPEVTVESVREQVEMVKRLGVNYMAIGTPYDRVDDLRLWTEEIHGVGLQVWFRSHWAEWEGDDGQPAVMSPEEYLQRTKEFILFNQQLFKTGDAFTVCVEPEQVGVGLGKRFLTWHDYREFILAQVAMADEAFKEIGLEGKVHTNWISVNGWVVENQFSQELIDRLGLIVVDHFVGQSETIGELDDIDTVVELTLKDLDRYNGQWGVPILLGEWGYQIFQETPNALQAVAVERLMAGLKAKKYIVGMNYWTHMGNTSSLIKDDYGMNLRYRLAAKVVKEYYDPLGNSGLVEFGAIDR